MAATNKLNLGTSAAQETPAPAVAEKRPTGDAREYITTSLRFKRPLMAKLKKAAIDRDQSFQEMVESALAQMFERDNVKIAGLRK